jgi:undecaprenyl pyrophosphate phosphatase UppP
MILISYVYKGDLNLLSAAAFLLINGIVLFIPSRMLQGNKDARSMSALDSLLLGLCGALSALPGLSRIALQTSAVRLRGADSSHALNWALLLSIPALAVTAALSLFSLFTGLGAIQFYCGFFTYLLIFFSTYLGSYLAIFFMRILASKNSLSLFAYYSWGAALFVFIMYLI